MENYRQDNSDLFTLEVDETAKSTFLEMARWTKFLSILGFIFLGLMILAGIALSAMVDSLGSSSPFAVFGAVGTMAYFLFLAAVTFYPVLALLKFSTGVKNAINTTDKLQFNKAIRALKNTFKYYGILMILFLGLYGVALVVAVIYGAMLK